MKWGQGIPHQGKQALTALVLTVAFVAPACAQRRFALTPGTAQTPSAAKRQTSGDDAMSGLDKALQNAGIDSEPGRNIKTIVNFVPDDVRTERITQLTSSFNKLASAPDGQGAQAALLEVGGAVAGAALLADWHIHNDYAPKYANDRVRNIARFVEAITPILKRTGVGYTDASIKNAEEKGGGMLWRGTEGFLAASIGKSRPSALAALAADGPAFATEPDDLSSANIVRRIPGAESVTAPIAVIETNSYPGNGRTGTNHLGLYYGSVDFEYRKARNLVPKDLQSPYPLDEVLTSDIAAEALKFSGPNLEKLKNVTAGLAAHATLYENGSARGVTAEDVSQNLEQMRHGSPQEVAQAKAALRAWLRESVEYQLRHLSADGRRQ